ncbi:MAG: Gfo/Idh/MocA family oxidoreductase [Bacteroidetes bacterium]|nr:Gfo/Idh/MocA family oxidoreductase [Bacteroidota bacterium]
MKNFALIGAAGYIAPRHLKAIKETGNRLITAVDKFDSVGILDSYFPETSFFTEFERFDRHVEVLRAKGTTGMTGTTERGGDGEKERRRDEEIEEATGTDVARNVSARNVSARNFFPPEEAEEGRQVDYVSVCTPNYLHDAHIRFGLRVGADVICEKPLVLNPWNIEALAIIEKETGKKVFNILQLRLHPSIIALKKRISEGPKNKIYDLDLTYITSRGKWYYTSWKGDVSKSGGIATNIGVHFYDMLGWVFGEVKENIVHVASHDRVSGFLQFEKARVRYFLSINEETLPSAIRVAGKRTYRLLEMDGEEIEFSDGFTDLHTESYRQILQGNGFPLLEAMPSIRLVHNIRHAVPVGLKGDYHPFARLALSKHPFEK